MAEKRDVSLEQQIKGWVTLAIIIGLGVMVFSCWVKGPGHPPPRDMQSCRDNWRACVTQQQLVNEWTEFQQVRWACKDAANAQAAYGNPDWPWGAFEYAPLNGSDAWRETGTVLLQTPDVEFPNAFGGRVKALVTCVYEISSGSVVNIIVGAGR